MGNPKKRLWMTRVDPDTEKVLLSAYIPVKKKRRVAYAGGTGDVL